MIRESEANKARLYTTPGNPPIQFNPAVNWPLVSGLVNNTQSAMSVDENYLVIRAHVEPSLQQKIVNIEYIDFARLIPKSKVTRSDDDHRMELVSCGGLTYFL